MSKELSPMKMGIHVFISDDQFELVKERQRGLLTCEHYPEDYEELRKQEELNGKIELGRFLNFRFFRLEK